MQANYIVTLPPSRRRDRRLFTGNVSLRPLFRGLETDSPKRRLAAAAAVLAVGLPLAWGLIGILPGMSDEADEENDAVSFSLPALPPPASPAVVPQLPLAGAALPVLAGAIFNAPVPETAARPAPPPLPVAERKTVTLKKGETLLGLLMDAAVPEAEAHEAMSALKTVYNPKVMRAGQDVDVMYDNGAFRGFEFEPSSERAVRVELQGGNYKAAAIRHPLARQVMAASATVDSSMFEAGAAAGVPNGAMVAMIKALSYSVDFQRDIHAGDSFKVLYETMRAPDGTLVKTGDILYAQMKLRDRLIPIYRYAFSDGRVEYFDSKGKSLRKALLRTPIDGARVSSGFGARRHPILGYTKMHKGMDFAAPTGTPIFAAGDGVVMQRGWVNGYGNFVQIRHSGVISTAYGHLSRFNPNVIRGSSVKQGQVIGYVGSTGRSTGPHLHFELRANNNPVNPASIRNMPSGEALAGPDLTRFKGMVAAIDRHFENVSNGQVIAVSFDGGAKTMAAQVRAD